MRSLNPLPSVLASRRAIVLGVFFAALASVHAYATSVVRLDDEALVRVSSIVVEGHVTGVRSGWNADHTQIQTTVTLQVSREIKGAAPGNGVLVLRLLGGQVGDTVMEAIGQPKFALDEDVIVFLEEGAPELFPIAGLHQGKFTVAPDPKTGTPTVVGRDMSRDAFVRDVSRIVAQQNGGR